MFVGKDRSDPLVCACWKVGCCCCLGATATGAALTGSRSLLALSCRVTGSLEGYPEACCRAMAYLEMKEKKRKCQILFAARFAKMNCYSKQHQSVVEHIRG